MSTDTKWVRRYAMEQALGFKGMIEKYCDEVMIAGSIRREKEQVGDIEIVAIPRDTTLLAMLDMKEHRGEIRKWRYVDKNGVVSYRWGEKYRGIEWGPIRIELFLADANNWGFIQWLRTGPGDANQQLVTLLKYQNVIRSIDGDVWEVGGTPDNPQPVRKLRVPDEQTWFTLIGLPYIAPKMRTSEIYNSYGVNPLRGEALDKFTAEFVLKQKGMF